MMSRQKCLDKAGELEQVAAKTIDPINRNVLLETARHWRTLADARPLTVLGALSGKVGAAPAQGGSDLS